MCARGMRGNSLSMSWGFSVLVGTSSVTVAVQREERRVHPLTCTAIRADSCAVLMGRLYYREDLRSSLNSVGATVGGLDENDATLALETVRKWGGAGLVRLEGDFSVVVWLGRERVLYCARDPMGAFPLYYGLQKGAIRIATSIEEFASPRTASLDTDFIADYLSQGTLAMMDSATPHTAYAGVNRVMPGGLITVRTSDLSVENHKLWDWRDHVRDPGTDRTEALAEAFAPLLREAVQERIGRRTAAHLSGGMDSTAVALIAASKISERAGASPLHAISLVYQRIRTLACETKYIDSALEGRHDIVSHRLDGDELLAFDRTRNGWPTDEPTAAELANAQNQAIAEVASAAGVDTILTGIGADDVFELSPVYIADMIRNRDLSPAWREAVAWARVLALNPTSVLAQYGLSPLASAYLRARSPKLLPRLLGAECDLAPWIRPRFARDHSMQDRLRAQRHRIYGDGASIALSTAIASVRGWAGSGRGHGLAERGVVLTHPFLDPRVISLGLGLRLRCRPDPREHKPILAAALSDVLPEKIRKRRNKVNFNEVYYRGLARNCQVLETLVGTTEKIGLEIFEPDILINHLRRAALGTPGTSSDNIQLELAISLVIWLTTRSSRTSLSAGRVESIEFPIESSNAWQVPACR